MGQVLHGSALTTQAVRGSIQRSQESLQTVAKRHNIDRTSQDAYFTTAHTSTGPVFGNRSKYTFCKVKLFCLACSFRPE